MYIIPILGDNKIAYKGRRFWIVELTGQDDFEFISKDEFDYVLYDKLVGCLIATIKRLDGEKVKVFLNGYDAVTYEFDSLKIAARQAPILIWRYFNDMHRQ